MKKITVKLELLEKLFEGFSILRWNDRIRPHEFSQMEKESHKMFLAYLFGRIEESKKEINWKVLIETGVFQLLKKIALSDIKVVVQRKISEDEELNSRLNDWIVNQYGSFFSKDFLDAFGEYLENEEDMSKIEYKILRAAHKYSTLREFEILGAYAERNSLFEATESEIYKDLLPFMDFEGLQQMLAKQDLYKFNLIFEQLRYQVRWSQTPRIPKTTVMGHAVFVAVLMFLFTRQITDSKEVLFCNFYAGLFHDLPESVTRDIISPIKHAVAGLDEIIGKIEEEVVEQEMFRYLNSEKYSVIKEELAGFTKNEFTDRSVTINGEISSVINGRILKLADELAAMMEASKSMLHGITSDQLETAVRSIYNSKKGLVVMGEIDVSDVAEIFTELFELTGL